MQVGQVISGKYRLVRLLGDGGMGSVYEALHEKLGSKVAIKFLHAELARRAGLGERFLQEARVAAQIKSPHVVQVTDIDQTPPPESAAYIVMELLLGEPLSGVLERQGKLGVPMSCEYTRQILEALEAAHALGVIHRDLKPENVFVTLVAGKPVLKLIDFGIAKLKRPDSAPGVKNLTVAGVLMGTAEYMAPEQAFSADKVDARSDVYSVGVMLYEMIAGRRPVSGDDARVIAMKVERGDITPLVHAAPDVPREIAGLVHRAMASRPELRFATATEMRLALEGALRGERPPTLNLQAQAPLAKDGTSRPLAERGLHQLEAGTGTVMGAPADALLGASAPIAPPQPGPMNAGPQTAIGSGTDRVAPVHIPMPISEPPAAAGVPRRSGRGWLIALLLLLGLGAIGAIVASQYDLLPSADATPDTPPATTPPTPAPPTPATVATAPTSTAKPGDTLAPLVTPPQQPHPNPHPPAPRPSGSTPGPSPSSTPTTPDIPPFPPMPSVLPPFPFPLPSGSGAMPFPPIPIPGFGPAPQPQPTPVPTNSAAGY
jgi:serine/threonine-protein kinase